MDTRFKIEVEITRQYRRFNDVGTQLTVRLLPPPNEENPVSHFLASVNDLFQHALQGVSDSDMVGITIQNEVNQNDKAIGISFRCKDQLSGDVIWSVFEKVSQSNSNFNALDKLVVMVHSVRMPVGFGRVKARCRPISVMAHLKRSIVEVKAEENCLAHALIIAIARLKNDPNYKAYRQGNKIRPVVQNLLETTGINLHRGGGIRELERFQDHFKEYRIVVFAGLNCDVIYFDGRVNSEKRINILYDDVEHHYHVITNVTGTMARLYVCKGCNKGCRRDVSHICDQTCTDCMSSPRARSRAFESPATRATGILGAGHVSTSIRKKRGATRRVCVSASDVAPRAAY